MWSEWEKEKNEKVYKRGKERKRAIDDNKIKMKERREEHDDDHHHDDDDHWERKKDEVNMSMKFYRSMHMNNNGLDEKQS